MDRALTRCRYALAISILSYLAGFASGAYLPAIASIAAMALFSAACVILQVILLVRGRPGERYQRR